MNERQRILEISKNVTISALEQTMAAFIEATMLMTDEQRGILTKMITDGSDENVEMIAGQPDQVAFLRLLASHTWGQILVGLADQTN